MKSLAAKLQLDVFADSLQTLDLAAEQRYQEGINLITSFPYGAIYLLGYCVEIWLKNSVFLCDGARFSDSTQQHLYAARRLGNRLRGKRPKFPDDDHYHSILFWAKILVYKLENKGHRNGAPASKKEINEIIQRAEELSNCWHPSMRYRWVEIQASEWQSFQAHVDWFRLRYPTGLS
jgi:hypothetical protein